LPYFDIAMNYGYANCMFQTNEGPSFPAHQVIFSGTSAPVPPGDFFGNDRNFVAENPLGKASNKDSGCDDLRRERALWVDPTGTEFDPGRPLDEPCYHHDSLVTLLDAHGKTWRYYTPIPGKIWTAPTAITDICGPVINGLCRGPDYANVVWPAKVGVPVPIYDDIKHCNLPQVSWAIPDEKWSDHPGRDNDKGPSYVANLVNLVGESRCVDSNGKTYWHNTAILITWDDWGGWFDHVLPPPCTAMATLTATFSGDAEMCTDSASRCWWFPPIRPNGTFPARSRVRAWIPSTLMTSEAF
jgi:phospholipase C